TAGRSSAVRSPRVHSTSGGSTIAASAGGYARSFHAIGASPCVAPRFSASAALAASAARLRGGEPTRWSSTAAADSPSRSRSLIVGSDRCGSSERAMNAGRSVMAAPRQGRGQNKGGRAPPPDGAESPTSIIYYTARRGLARTFEAATLEDTADPFRKSAERSLPDFGRFLRLSCGICLAHFWYSG